MKKGNLNKKGKLLILSADKAGFKTLYHEYH
jgi:hypothetical protein